MKKKYIITTMIILTSITMMDAQKPLPIKKLSFQERKVAEMQPFFCLRGWEMIWVRQCYELQDSPPDAQIKARFKFFWDDKE